MNKQIRKKAMRLVRWSIMTVNDLIELSKTINENGFLDELREIEREIEIKSMTKQSKYIIGACPDCGGNLINVGGCRECSLRCGYSECG